MRPVHRILTILIAGLMPFCCCSIKAVAALASGPDACTFAYAGCCSGGQGDCGEDPSSDSDEDCKGGCCDRLAPVGELQDPLPPLDDIGLEQLHGNWPSAPALGDPGSSVEIRRPRPPDPGSGSLQGLHCRLQV